MRKFSTVVAAVLAAALSTLSAAPAAAAVLPGSSAKPTAVLHAADVAKAAKQAAAGGSGAPRAMGMLPPTTRTPAARLLGKPVRGLAAVADVPASVDLSASMPAIGNQGGIGACVTWAINYAIMGYHANVAGGTGAPYAPLYTYMRIVRGAVPSAGTSPEAALAMTRDNGVDTQDDYWQGTGNYKAKPTAAEIANAVNYKISGFTTLWNGGNQGVSGETLVKQALAGNTPVAIGFPVFPDFFSHGTGVYNTTSGSVRGYHMVAAIGYDADGVTIQNSWGSGWGNGGRAKVSWNFMGTAVNSAHVVAGITTPALHADTRPLVTALSTKAGTGAGGTTVAITGGGLRNASQVTFGGTDAAFTRSTTHGVTTITATTPAHAAGVVDVAVTNPAGTSAASTAGKFTFKPPPPAVSGLSATSGTAVGGQTLTITGSYLAGARQVRIGTALQKFRVVSNTEIAVTTARSAAVTGNVTVNGPGGTSPVVDGAQYTFVAPAAPSVTGLDVTSGFTYGGAAVTVTGADFTYATKVLLGGKSVAFKRVSATALKFTTPVAPAGAVNVQVADQWSLSGAVPAGQFTYQTPPVPAITALSRTTGPTYLPSALTITGTGFTRVSKVVLEGKAAPFKFVSDTTITATVPPRTAGAVTVQVTTPGGTSAPVDVAKYTYVAPPVPTVTGLSATEALTYVSTPVTITGTDFVVVSKVLVGGKSVAYKRINGTTVTATVPPRTAGTVDVQVVTPGGTSAVAAEAKFTYVAPPVPAVTSLSATSGLTYVSTPVVVTGTGLTAASRVLVNGVSAPFTKVNDTTVKTTLLPRAAGPVDIQVVTPGGTSATAAEGVFTYVAPPAPVVTSLSPSTGYTIANTPVTITGTDLTAASKVFVGDKSVPFKRVSPTSITFTAPARAAGVVQVTVVTPGGTSEGSAFTYEVPPAPTLTALSSATGAVGAARWVTATGTTLASVSQALMGTTAVTFTRVSDTSIKIELPARDAAGVVDITVVGPGGTSPGAVQYTYTA